MAEEISFLAWRRRRGRLNVAALVDPTNVLAFFLLALTITTAYTHASKRASHSINHHGLRTSIRIHRPLRTRSASPTQPQQQQQDGQLVLVLVLSRAPRPPLWPDNASPPHPPQTHQQLHLSISSRRPHHRPRKPPGPPHLRASLLRPHRRAIRQPTAEWEERLFVRWRRRNEEGASRPA